MSAPVRCLLALTLLLAVAGAGAAVTGGQDDGRSVTPAVAAEPMDTSWGDHYVPVQL